MCNNRSDLWEWVTCAVFCLSPCIYPHTGFWFGLLWFYFRHSFSSGSNMKRCELRTGFKTINNESNTFHMFLRKNLFKNSNFRLLSIYMIWKKIFYLKKHQSSNMASSIGFFLKIKSVVKIRTNLYFNFVCEMILVFCFNLQFIQHLFVRSILYQHRWAGRSQACGHHPLAEVAVLQNLSSSIGRSDSASWLRVGAAVQSQSDICPSRA